MWIPWKLPMLLGGAIASDLNRSQNPRVLNWQDWANDMRSQGIIVQILAIGRKNYLIIMKKIWPIG